MAASGSGGNGGVDRPTAILDAASRLFADRGYRGTSIASVAEVVGITDAGVLYHFKTKEELLLGVLRRYGEAVEANLELAGLRGIELLRFMREWGAGMEASPAITAGLVVLTSEHLTDDAPARRFLQAAYRHGLDRYRAAFVEAAADGHLRADLDPDAEASALVAHMDGLRLQWFLLDRGFSLAESVRRYVDQTLLRLGA